MSLNRTYCSREELRLTSPCSSSPKTCTPPPPSSIVSLTLGPLGFCFLAGPNSTTCAFIRISPFPWSPLSNKHSLEWKTEVGAKRMLVSSHWQRQGEGKVSQKTERELTSTLPPSPDLLQHIEYSRPDGQEPVSYPVVDWFAHPSPSHSCSLPPPTLSLSPSLLHWPSSLAEEVQEKKKKRRRRDQAPRPHKKSSEEKPVKLPKAYVDREYTCPLSKFILLGGTPCHMSDEIRDITRISRLCGFHYNYSFSLLGSLLHTFKH